MIIAVDDTVIRCVVGVVIAAVSRGTLTAEMIGKRIELATRMRELNDSNGKGSASAANAEGVM